MELLGEWSSDGRIYLGGELLMGRGANRLLEGEGQTEW